MNTQTDPLADLKAEIEAEEAQNAAAQAEAAAAAAAEAGKPAAEAAEQQADAPEGEGGDGEETAEAKAREESDGVKKRLNDANAARRIAEKRAASLEAELAKVKNGGTPEPAKEETQEDRDNRIRAQARAEALLEVQVTNFAVAGSTAFGEKEFEAACNEIADMGGNIAIMQNALAALDTPGEAARAIWQLSQQEPAEIQRVLNLHPLKQATALLKLANARTKKETAAEEAREKPAPRKPAVAPAASKPINPVGGAAKQQAKEISDDMSDEEFDAVWRNDSRLGGPVARQ